MATNKQRLEKLIQDLQEMNNDSWEILSIGVTRMNSEDGKKVFIAEVEILEQ